MPVGFAFIRRFGGFALLLALFVPIGITPAAAQDEPDTDTVVDLEDNCPDAFNPAQFESDKDGACDDVNNDDLDGDLISNDQDNCPDAANTGQIDWDHDGIGDTCDSTPRGEDTRSMPALPDSDGDGVTDDVDNCPLDDNPDQHDADGDRLGDACDPLPDGNPVPALPDSDGDGVTDDVDNCPLDDNPDQHDADGDRLGDACDPLPDGNPVPTMPDSDGDGVTDDVDNCPLDPDPDQNNSDGDRLGDACDPTPNGGLIPGDSDNDLQPDDTDNCPETANTRQLDTDGDGTGDACDTPDMPVNPLVTVELAGSGLTIVPGTVSYVATVTSNTDALTNVILSQELPRADVLDWTTTTPGCRIEQASDQQRLLCPRIVMIGDGQSFIAEVSSATSKAICGETLRTTAIADPGQGEPVTSNQVNTAMQCPTTRLAVTTTPDTGVVTPGLPILYDISVANVGQYDAVDVGFTVQVLDAVSWSVLPAFGQLDCDIDGDLLTCGSALLPAGEHRAVTLIGVLPAKADSCELDLAIMVTADASNAETTSDGGSYSAVCQPIPTVNMATVPDDGTASTGDTIGFVITLKNVGFGPVDDAGFVVSPLPHADDVTWTLGDEALSTCELVPDAASLTCSGIELSGNDGALGGADAVSVTVTAQAAIPSSAGTCITSYTAMASLVGEGTSTDSATVEVTCVTGHELCVQQALDAGLDPADYQRIIAGSVGDDLLGYPANGTLFCGFGGVDSVDMLRQQDAFLGGADNDHVTNQFGGGFIGGEGDDTVTTLHYGVFNGNGGDDRVGTLLATFFNGGSGNDVVSIQTGGTFNGNEGDDTVVDLRNGSVNGLAGDDSVVGMIGGIFTGADGDDTVENLAGSSLFLGLDGNDTIITMSDGQFLGGSGTDTVSTLVGGRFNGMAGDDLVTTLRQGTFEGMNGNDRVETLLDGTFDGNAGDDTVVNLGDPEFGGKGVFNGGEGDDAVVNKYGGAFNPGPEPAL